ncbi:MAG: MarR family winged helix-turn-helix transcriptional regulator [Desulfobulbaceae bacterium]
MRSDDCRFCACFNLRRAARSLTRLYDQALRGQNIRVTQFSVLAVLASMGEQSICSLADILAADRTTLTRNLGVLEKNGLVTTATGPDRRTRKVGLTRAGREKLAAALPLWNEAQQRVVESLGPERFASLHTLLDELSRLDKTAAGCGSAISGRAVPQQENSR